LTKHKNSTFNVKAVHTIQNVFRLTLESLVKAQSRLLCRVVYANLQLYLQIVVKLFGCKGLCIAAARTVNKFQSA